MSETADEGENRFGLADLIAAIVIGALFLANAYVGLGNLIGVPQELIALGHPQSTPWVSLGASVVVPLVFFVSALLVGRGRTTFERTLILIVAVAAASGVGLTLVFVSLSAIPLG